MNCYLSQRFGYNEHHQDVFLRTASKEVQKMMYLQMASSAEEDWSGSINKPAEIERSSFTMSDQRMTGTSKSGEFFQFTFSAAQARLCFELTSRLCKRLSENKRTSPTIFTEISSTPKLRIRIRLLECVYRMQIAQLHQWITKHSFNFFLSFSARWVDKKRQVCFRRKPCTATHRP